MSDGSVFWRITGVHREADDPWAASLIEIDADGYIPREVDVNNDGTPIRVTRPGEYGVFNDSPGPRAAPGTPEFDANWASLGNEVSRDEFEAVYERALAIPRPRRNTARHLLYALIIVGIALLIVDVLVVGMPR